MVERTCLFCGNIFKTWNAWIKRYNNTGGRFCSLSCNCKYNKSHLDSKRSERVAELKLLGISIGGRKKNRVEITCFTCKVKFEVPLSQRSTICCSRKCSVERRKTLPKRPYKPNTKIAGENHYNWKGGITELHVQIRNSQEYKIWRKSVFERDFYTCQLCGIRNKVGVKVKFHADHIKSFAEYPDLRLEVSNGRTLCIECHKRTPSFGVNVNRKPGEQADMFG